MRSVVGRWWLGAFDSRQLIVYTPAVGQMTVVTGLIVSPSSECICKYSERSNPRRRFDICPSRGQLGASFTKGATRDTPLPPSSRHQSWEHHFGRVVDFLCFPQDFSFRPSTCSEEDTSFGDHLSISNRANHPCELINFYALNIIILQETTDG